MAGLNGVNLIKELENQQILLPILVITGYGREEKIVELKKMKNIECIDKPFGPQALLENVNKTLNKETVFSSSDSGSCEEIKGGD